MSGWNGTGGFSLPYSWTIDAANNIPITASRMDTQFATISVDGFNNTLTRDGQGSASANLPMNTFNHTNVGNATAATQYLALGQFQSGAVVWAIATGTADVITLSILPAIAALTDGMEFRFRAIADNATTTPTLQVSSTTAHTITKNGGDALVAGDIQNGMAITVRYDLPNTRWDLLTINSVSGLGTAAFANTGTSGHTLGFLDGANTYSATQAFASITLSGTISGGTTASFSGNVTTNGTNVIGTNAQGAKTISTSAPSGTPANGDIWLTRAP